MRLTRRCLEGNLPPSWRTINLIRMVYESADMVEIEERRKSLLRLWKTVFQ
ncbi:hypothetical protein Poly51_25020 [Rubripirellula tenax]|uniref:Uncharacterized protein n=1 Tax=Rubripirellula tenax TaxID=2528015 RepID=A0A5C6F8X8_9BACT|nr:hypothetical protein Poly51_25020 [Rubripirellula tenax]